MIQVNRFSSVEERFWSRITKYPESCWVWTGCKSKGYGRIKVNGVMIQAHRLSYSINVGDIPTGYDVLHKCDNKPCVNPSHLYLGNASQNMKDYISRRSINRRS